MAKHKHYSQKGYKILKCSKCDIPVHRVADDAVAVTCWKCTMQTIKKYETVIGETDTR